MSSFSVKRRLYQLGIRIYTAAIHMASLFNVKARLWVEGRKNLRQQLIHWRNEHPGPLCWIHAASLGEYEMAVPLMEQIKVRHPDMLLLVTFFSPSGYEVRKNHALPDGIFYLPPDTVSNAHFMAGEVRPECAIFIKYEIWLNYLFALRDKHIPAYLVNAMFRKEQRFFKKNSIFLQGLKSFRHICVQYEDSEKLLRSHGIENVTTSGDLRFDRVQQIAASGREIPAISGFKGNSKLIIGGSTWHVEEKMLSEALRHLPGWKLALFPHEFKGKRRKELEQIFEQHQPVYWSENQNYTGESSVYIIDTIGMLSNAYQYADLAFVGGGFSGKLHNMLEPLAFGVPVITGPKTSRFEEAVHFEQEGWLRKVQNATELAQAIQTFRKPSYLSRPVMPQKVAEQVFRTIQW